MAENGTYTDNLWTKTLGLNGKTYILAVNTSDTLQNKTIATAASFAKVLVSTGNAAVQISGGQPELSLPRDSMLFIEASTLQPAGLYIGNVAYCRFKPGIVYRKGTADTGTKQMGALYQWYDDGWELLQVLQDGESPTVNQGIYQFKAFSWNTGQRPTRAAVTVANHKN